MKKKHVLVLVGLCYGVYLVWNIAAALLFFADDAIARATGSLQTQQFTFGEVQVQNIDVQSDTAAVATSEDPQILLYNLDTTARMLTFQIAFSRDPGEVTLYYAAPGKDFAKEKKVYGKRKSDGSYTFLLPRTEIDALRIDPTNQNHVTMELQALTLNPPRTFGSYFAVTYEDLFRFFVYPGLFAVLAGYGLGLAGPARVHAVLAAGRKGCARVAARRKKQ